MRLILISGLLVAGLAGCDRKQPAQPASAQAKPVAAWEPIDPAFTGCAGG